MDNDDYEMAKALLKDKRVTDLLALADDSGKIAVKTCDFFLIHWTLFDLGYVTNLTCIVPHDYDRSRSYLTHLTEKGMELRTVWKQSLTPSAFQKELATLHALNQTFETLLSNPINYSVLNADSLIRIWQEQLSMSVHILFEEREC